MGGNLYTYSTYSTYSSQRLACAVGLTNRWGPYSFSPEEEGGGWCRRM